MFQKTGRDLPSQNQPNFIYCSIIFPIMIIFSWYIFFHFTHFLSLVLYIFFLFFGQINKEIQRQTTNIVVFAIWLILFNLLLLLLKTNRSYICMYSYVALILYIHIWIFFSVFCEAYQAHINNFYHCSRWAALI